MSHPDVSTSRTAPLFTAVITPGCIAPTQQALVLELALAAEDIRQCRRGSRRRIPAPLRRCALPPRSR